MIGSFVRDEENFKGSPQKDIQSRTIHDAVIIGPFASFSLCLPGLPKAFFSKSRELAPCNFPPREYLITNIFGTAFRDDF
jgi:hypothetical protein